MEGYFEETISYVTKLVDSSVIILDSPEDEVVLDALLYLSKFVDLDAKNLDYLLNVGLLPKLLNLLDRNICVVRLTLRLLEILVSNENVVNQLDTDAYDDRILEISDMFISNMDPYVRQLSLSILIQLADSCRMTNLIFSTDLFDCILFAIKDAADMVSLEGALKLFLKFLNPSIKERLLQRIYDFDISILLKYLENTEKKTRHIILQIIFNLIDYGLNILNNMFKNANLVENMLEIVVNGKKREYHEMALNIIMKYLESAEDSDYFIETLEFLKFCQWVKRCDHNYLYPCILILEKLTEIPNRRQILFDLSVEDSILSFLRSTDKRVLSKTYNAISNMAAHRYCCEKMFTPAVVRELFRLLIRKDQEEPGNEIILKTILDFSATVVHALDMIHNLGGHRVLLGYFKKGTFISEENFLGVLEILFRMSLHPVYQLDIVGTSFFEKLLHLFQKSSPSIAAFSCKILTNFIDSCDFRRMFLSLDGPKIFVGMLLSSSDIPLLRNTLIFIHNNFTYDNMIETFLENNLVKVLKQFPGYLKLRIPIANKILRLIYKRNLPLKFFDTKRLDITDKLQNKFYLIDGQWKYDFVTSENLEAYPMSIFHTMYVVDYSFAVKFDDDSTLESTVENNISSALISSSLSGYLQRISFQINYGKISQDPILPFYIHQVTKYLARASTMKEKVTILSEYIDAVFRKPVDGYVNIDKLHNFRLHVEMLKHYLGSNVIPIGFLRLGCHCERALLFKALADKCSIPASLVNGTKYGSKLYWNEVILHDSKEERNTLKLYVVDLMNNIGNLVMVGSKAAEQYCQLES